MAQECEQLRTFSLNQRLEHKVIRNHTRVVLSKSVTLADGPAGLMDEAS